MKQAALRPGRRPVKERTRRPEDAPSFAVGNDVRLEALTILHEGPSCASEIADMIGQDVRKVTHHLRELYDAGCIEFVGRTVEGNITKALYRAVARHIVDDEEYEKMSIAGRHDLNGTALQWILAEALLSHRNGTMDRAESTCLISDEPNLDTEGRRELLVLCKEMAWAETDDTPEIRASIQEIACRAANRMAESGENGKTMVVALLAFERGRAGRTKAKEHSSAKNER